MEHVQTKREIEALLDSAGLQPRKRFGQHFLIDGNLMRRLVESAEIDPNDFVLEVGPGTGGLTDLLVPRAGHLVSVELDRDLHAMLVDRFAQSVNLTLILDDILDGKHHIRTEVAELLRNRSPGNGGAWKLVANLPYNVATPLLLNLLIDYPQVRRFCFTVQAEVGDRLTAQPCNKTFGPLSILAQSLSRVQTVARLSPEVFWPRPAVDSVMLRMDVIEAPFRDRDSLRRFAAFVRGTFDHRRKTLRSALGYVIDNAARDRICERVDGQRRPEAFSIAEWLEMFVTSERSISDGQEPVKTS